MNYHFYHECDDALLQQIKIIAEQQYLLLCLGMNNYFYSASEDISTKIRGLLFTKGVIVSAVSDSDLKEIIQKILLDSGAIIHGIKALLEKLQVAES